MDKNLQEDTSTTKNIKLDVIYIQEQLLIERRIRITIMSLLLAALLFTVIFGTLQNPFQYTFSKIGNRFDNRILFVFWAIFTGGAIQTSILALFRLEHYKSKFAYKFIVLGTVFLVLSAIIPALAETYPIWTWLHVITAGLYGIFLSLGIAPFIRFVSRQNPRLKSVIKVWAVIIWVGSVAWMFILGNTGIFELWGFGIVILFLLYLSLTLFEEQIVKRSVRLLQGENDLNSGIEKIFFRRKKRNKKS